MKLHITNTDRVPIRQLSNGSWQLRKRIAGGKRIEIMLGTADKSVATERAKKILSLNTDRVLHETWAQAVKDGLKMKGWLWRMVANMQSRAKIKGFAAEVDSAFLESVALRSGGRCEVSGIAFYVGPERRHPFQPSIDRIDSSRGYEPDNVRLVCLSVNMCMAQWGDAVFHRIAAATVANKLARLADEWIYSAQPGEKVPRADADKIA